NPYRIEIPLPPGEGARRAGEGGNATNFVALALTRRSALPSPGGRGISLQHGLVVQQPLKSVASNLQQSRDYFFDCRSADSLGSDTPMIDGWLIVGAGIDQRCNDAAVVIIRQTAILRSMCGPS